jgi:hypothetical protein
MHLQAVSSRSAAPKFKPGPQNSSARFYQVPDLLGGPTPGLGLLGYLPRPQRLKRGATLTRRTRVSITSFVRKPGPACA